MYSSYMYVWVDVKKKYGYYLLIHCRILFGVNIFDEKPYVIIIQWAKFKVEIVIFAL